MSYESRRPIHWTDWLESIGGVVVIAVILRAVYDLARSVM
jgi:hypothetical protein